MIYTIDKKLMEDMIDILEYFDKGLSDVRAGSEEDQPQLKEIKSALRRLKNKKRIREYLR